DAVLEEDQSKRWQELCISLGRLVEYLNDGLPSFEIKYNVEDVFTKGEFDTAFVSFEGPNKLSKIDFTISKDDEKAKYQWTFSPYDYWLQSFNLFPLFKSSLMENSGNVLPIFTTEQLGNLLTSTDTESFHYQLKSYEISMVNVMDEISKLRTRESIIFTRLFSLCDPFSNVVEEICNNGLYYAINARRSTNIAVLVNKYAEAITAIYQSFHDFTKVEKDYLYLVSNVFSIISSKEELSSLTKVEGAIIPPYHPSMLEKIEAQQLYLRQGFSEVIDDIIAGSMLNLKSCTRRFESL
ncbi:hypothetical protein JQK62_20005, partial [Leptospira santarosai]|nr:hypothetical protein [Leptospira santarosai]